MTELPPQETARPVIINQSAAPLISMADERKRRSKPASPFEAEMRADGLYIENVRIASPRFEIVARTATNAGERCGLVLQWIGERGRLQEYELKLSDLYADGGKSVCAALADRGLRIVPSRGREFVDFLNRQAPEELRVVSGPTGWSEDGFALPDSFYAWDGTITQSTVYGANRFQARGSHHEWRDNVGRLAQGNPRIVFSVSTAFAATLLHFSGEESGGFHTPGASSRGKTTTLNIAGSVWGPIAKDEGGDENYVVTGRATANGVEGIAEQSNDVALLIDEIGLAAPKELAALIFMIASGIGKLRANRRGDVRSAKTWRTLFLTTAERSISDLLQAADPKSQTLGGQAVRLIDLPPVEDEGCFVELHGAENAGRFAEGLKDAASKYHGTAGREFVKLCIAKRAILPDAVRKGIDRFVEAECPAGTSGQVRRAARRFGLVAIAGEIAAQITGWQTGEATHSAKSLFKAWVRQRGGYAEHELGAGVNAVREFIERFQQSRFVETRTTMAAPAIGRIVTDIAGYVIEIDKQRVFGFTPRGFKEACAGVNEASVAGELFKQGLILAGEKEHLTRKVRIKSGHETSENEVRPRLYCVTAAILDGEVGR